MSEVLKRFGEMGVVPVVVLEDRKDAAPLAAALADGGIPCAEVTLRTAAGLDSIAEMAADGRVLVGAGSVRTLENCKDALSAGAKFIVSPGLNVKVVEHCLENDIAVLPGCVTPTEIMQAMELGLDTVKFFPASVYGGLSAMKALSGPFPTMRFVPTGGINAANLSEYLAAPFIAAVGGSWLCAKADIAAGDFGKITRLCREARQTMLGYELAHVGINTADAAASRAVCDMFAAAFGLPVKEGGSSNFVTPAIEVMNSPYLGTNGHIAIRTNSIMRAAADLEAKGYALNKESAKYKNGRLAAVYLEREIGGFAIHLLQK